MDGRLGSPQWSRRAVPAVVLALVAAALVALALAWWAWQPSRDRFAPVPEAAFPQIDGVTILTSVGVEGNACCEQHLGSREFVVRVDGARGADALEVVMGGMLRAGWRRVDCSVASRALVCLDMEGYFAVLRGGHGGDAGRDVAVVIERSS